MNTELYRKKGLTEQSDSSVQKKTVHESAVEVHHAKDMNTSA